jgi:osmotically-inducible protein OsmY
MTRKQRLLVVPVVGALAVAGWAVRAQDPPQSTTEKLKAKAGAAVQGLRKGAANVGEAIRDRAAKARSAAVALGIEGRVYARLHWEKALVGSKVELHAPSEGVITLSGTVVDAKARAKAVELATDTVGVTKVNDELTVQTATSGAAAPARP